MLKMGLLLNFMAHNPEFLKMALRTLELSRFKKLYFFTTRVFTTLISQQFLFKTVGHLLKLIGNFPLMLKMGLPLNFKAHNPEFLKMT